MKRRILNYGLKGYFTIEATLALSLVFWTILLVVFCGFYQYNRCLLTQDAYRIAMRGSVLKNATNTEVERKTNQEIGKWYFEKYIACMWNKREAEISDAEVKIKTQLDVNSPAFPKGFLMKEKLWGIHVTRISKRVNPVDVIKKCRVIEKLLRSGGENSG